MRILVIGMGVIGSYLTHELANTSHQVTVLARNERYTELLTNALVVQHTKQNKKTVDYLNVINHLDQADFYDIVFVVVQKSQLALLLSDLAEKKNFQRIVFIGNNCEVERTVEQFRDYSTEQQLLFGFLNCAGRRENGLVYSWHNDHCRINIGAAGSPGANEEMLRELFSETNLKLVFKKDINAWLKHHSALIVPLALAVQYHGENKVDFSKSTALLTAVDAVKESISMFESNGIANEPPHKSFLMKMATTKWRWLIGKLLNSESGQLMAIDHSLSAIDEIELLSLELLSYSQQFEYPLPSLLKLQKLA